MKESDLLLDLMFDFGQKLYPIPLLKEMTYPFRVTESSLRANLCRLNAKGCIVKSDSGGKVRYGLSEPTRESLTGVAQFRNYASDEEWNKHWLGVLFTVTESGHEERYPVRKFLSESKFACLYPGFWIRPDYPADSFVPPKEKSDPSVRKNFIRFEFDNPPSRDEIERLWKLGETNKSFIIALEMLHSSRQKLKSLDEEQSYIEKITVCSEIDRVLENDPVLPSKLLPKDWQGDSIRVEFERWQRDVTKQSDPFRESILKRM